MTKVYVVKCQKWNEKNGKFQIIDVFTNRKQAMAYCRIMTNDIHRYYYHEYEINKFRFCDYVSIANEIWENTEF